MPSRYILVPRVIATGKLAHENTALRFARTPGNEKLLNQFDRWWRGYDLDSEHHVYFPLPATGGFRGGMGKLVPEFGATPNNIAVTLIEQVGPMTRRFAYRLDAVYEEDPAESEWPRPMEMEEDPLSREAREIIDNADKAFEELTDYFKKATPKQKEEIRELMEEHVPEMREIVYDKETDYAMEALRLIKKVDEMDIFDRAERYLQKHRKEEARRQGLRPPAVAKRTREQRLEEEREQQAILKIIEDETADIRRRSFRKTTQHQSPGKYTELDDQVIAGRMPMNQMGSLTAIDKVRVGTLLLGCVFHAAKSEHGAMLLGALQNVCGHCETIGCHQRCSSCKKVYYCNRGCQENDWHTKHCQECDGCDDE